MLARFTDGPLDGTEREVQIAFSIIEVYWDGTTPAEDVPIFYVMPGTQEIWQYNLVDSDYETYADYLGNNVSAPPVLLIEPDVWSAAGSSFDVYSDEDPVEVVVNGSEIEFPDMGIIVRLAQRQGE